MNERYLSLKRLSMSTCLIGLALGPAIGVSGCSITQERTNSPMTSVEQLLLSQAVERGISDLTLPLPIGTAVALKSYGFTLDKEFAAQIVKGWFLDQGYRIVPLDVAPVTFTLSFMLLEPNAENRFSGSHRSGAYSFLQPFPNSPSIEWPDKKA